MICDFKKTIEKYNMISFGDTVIVGLSGGADSMTLLHLLNEIKDEYSLKIVAAHVNHCLRDDEADRDMNFCENVCKKLGIEIRTLVVDVQSEAKKNSESFEECGRRIRYEFFSSISENAKIATAHNLCDNEETVLSNLVRGTGISGLKGIPYVRGKIIRPLLDFSREQIESYCTKNQIPFVHDSTNDCDDYKRNFIRHNILTKLKEINPSFDTAFSNCISLLNDDYDYLENVSEDILNKVKIEENKYDISVLKKYHKAIVTRVLSKLIYHYTHVFPEKKHIDILYEAMMTSTKKVQITHGVFAIIKKDILYFVDNIENKINVETKIEKDGDYTFFNKKINVSFSSQKIYNEFSINTIDCDKINGNIILRNRRQGDKITLQKRNVTKSLKKLFYEDNIEEYKRSEIPVLADDNGVIWVCGYGADKRCAPDKKTKNVLNIVCITGEN